jgi:hypothetical protein
LQVDCLESTTPAIDMTRAGMEIRRLERLTKMPRPSGIHGRLQTAHRVPGSGKNFCVSFSSTITVGASLFAVKPRLDRLTAPKRLAAQLD